jgi:hypothetical protein
VAHPQVAAFARLANGGAQATRAIAGQNTLFTRVIHGIAYDSVHDEILVPARFAFAILTFRGDANGDVSPVRKIFGPNTQLVNPETVAVDGVNGEIYAPQPGRILVFRRETNGDAAPIRILETSNSQVAIDHVHNLLIVSGGGAIKIFDRTASGKAQPLRVITSTNGSLTVNPEKGLIFVSTGGGENDGGGGGGAGIQSPDGYGAPDTVTSRHALTDYVGVWSIYDSGNVPPRFTIGGPNLLLRDVRGVALDPKHQDVIVSDKTLNAVMRFHVPEVF